MGREAVVGALRRVTDQVELARARCLARGFPAPERHYVTAEEREAVIRDLKTVGKEVPPHVLKTMKKVTVAGVEIRALEVLPPEQKR